jgi:hypothetical protein
VKTGTGATGVYLNKKAAFALVTGVGDDITLFAIKGPASDPWPAKSAEARRAPRDRYRCDGKRPTALRWRRQGTKLASRATSFPAWRDFTAGTQPDGGS